MPSTALHGGRRAAARVRAGQTARGRGRHVCVGCQQRRSLFRFRGVVKADANHTLCFQCYRRLRDQARAWRLAGLWAGASGVQRREGSHAA